PDLPVLAITEPARAAFLSGPVAVRGTATAGTGALNALSIDDADVQLDRAGAFEHVATPPPGLFLIGSRLDDNLGERAVDARAVHVGAVHAPGALIAGAVYVELSRELLDDDDPAPDDVAAVVERVVTDPTFGDALVGQ